MINKVSTLPPLEKFLRTPMNDRAFSLSFFRYFRAFTRNKLFVCLRSLNFSCRILQTESTRFLSLFHQNSMQ